ncbi:nucleoside monophosphate kinase [Patescibacteria group bacterium]|nr:nucleoside monophosphate kinase [Patescibacteria group bacterium]
MDLILFGMQGSGKGTQSKYLATFAHLQVFETGAQLRRLAQEESELGQKVKSIIESGNLVPTEVVMEIISNFIHHLPEGKNALFDGIPRSKDQQEQFDALLKKENREFKCLNIKISEEEALKRLTTRRLCKKCKAVYPAFYAKETCEACGGELETRRDDTPDAIRVRIDTFLEKTQPVIDDYDSRGLMLTVNGEQSIEDVTKDSVEAIKPYF